MAGRKIFSRGILVIVFSTVLAGCGNPTAAAVPTPQPTIPATSTPFSSPIPQPTPTATFSVPHEVFHLIRSVTVTPDEHFRYGEFGYIHYVPATNRLVVMMNVFLDQPMNIPGLDEPCNDKAVGYKEYTLDLEPTGRYGFISCNFGDATSQILGNDIYLASMASAKANPDGTHDWTGFRLDKFDALTWQRLATVNIPIESPNEEGDGPTISFINGQVVVSGTYLPHGTGGDLEKGSYHNILTTDLQPAGKKILQPPDYPPHCPELSMLQLPGEGDILLFSGNTYNGDLVMIRMDRDWHVKQSRKLRDNGFFPTGSTTDGKLFYVAFMDTSLKGENFHVYSNAHVIAFDPEWNIVQDLALTDFKNQAGDVFTVGAATWVQLVGNRLYVSYQVVKMDMSSPRPDNQAYVNEYELTP